MAQDTSKEVKTYIVATDEYMGVAQNMYCVKSTFRELVENLLNIAEWDGEEELQEAAAKDDEELAAMLEDGNGDGQPYIMVWCVEDNVKVIG